MDNRRPWKRSSISKDCQVIIAPKEEISWGFLCADGGVDHVGYSY